MAGRELTRRATLAGLMGGAATIGVGAVAPARLWAAAPPAVSASDGVLTIDFDGALQSRLSWKGQPLTAPESGEGVRLADGTVIARDPTIPGGRADIRERSALVAMHLLRLLLRGEQPSL